MKKILLIFLFLLLSFPVQAKVKSKDIKFPGKFYTDEIKTCSAMPNVNFKLDFYKKKVEGLIGYDWPADHKANSNSLNVEHKNITEIEINPLIITPSRAVAVDALIRKGE